MCPKRVSVREEGEGHIPCRGTNDRKDAGTNSRESGMRNLVIGSIRSRAESTGGCVKLKTVTEMRQNSTHDVFTAKSVYLVLNSLLDWEPVQRLKQRSDVVSFMSFFADQGAEWGMGCEKRSTRQQRTRLLTPLSVRYQHRHISGQRSGFCVSYC